MDIITWAVIFPVGILLAGFLSCLKQTWPGIIPVGAYSLLFLCLHWTKSFEAESLADIFLILAICSVGIYGLCRLGVKLVTFKRRKAKNTEVKKSKVQDL